MLVDWSNGDQAALDELMPIIYEELRRMARRYMNRQSEGHTFQTTELIHEAYLKLAGRQKTDWKNRSHFFGVAARAMRHILVDYARSKNAQKRGGGMPQITFEENALISDDRSEEMIILDEALQRLSGLDERKSRVVEMKFFGGLTIEEIAEVLRTSTKTVKRDWRFARNWLLKEISRN